MLLQYVLTATIKVQQPRFSWSKGDNVSSDVISTGALCIYKSGSSREVNDIFEYQSLGTSQCVFASGVLHHCNAHQDGNASLEARRV